MVCGWVREVVSEELHEKANISNLKKKIITPGCPLKIRLSFIHGWWSLLSLCYSLLAGMLTITKKVQG